MSPASRLAAATALTALAAAAPAHAADPIMPLSQVKKGMRCTARSVIQGTDITTFDVEVLDVVAGDPADNEPLILVRVSGPAVDQTGIAEGFSGSPIYCPDDNGVQRVAGAIAFGTGDYGSHVVLATPIESILGQPVDPPVQANTRSRAARHKKPLATPIAVGGLSAPVAAAFRAAAARAHRALSTAPFAPVTSTFPPQQLVPGASLAVGMSAGDITAGAIGTVTYVDGDRIWGFGHAFDATGRRDLLLQDAYVYAVIGNPVGIDDAVSQKLAAPGHVLGTITADGPSGVAGHLGAAPPRIPLRVDARDGDTGARQVVTAQIADETSVGDPSGGSALSLTGPMAVSQAAFSVLGSAPARLSGQMCVRIAVKERPKPMRFCNTYVDAGGGAQDDSGDGPIPAGALVADMTDALTDVDDFKVGRLHVTSVGARLTLTRGLKQAFILRARAPRTVRRGRRVAIRLTLQHAFGGRFTRTIRVRIPAETKTGVRDLILRGTAANAEEDSGNTIDLTDALAGGTGSDTPTNAEGPRSVAALAREIADIHRYDGVRLTFADPGHDGGTGTKAYRDPDLRLSGRARVRTLVTP